MSKVKEILVIVAVIITFPVWIIPMFFIAWAVAKIEDEMEDDADHYYL